jgi:Na+-translocating membrane potential-generating system (MpsC)
LTGAEKKLAQSPVGAAQVREFHRQLFSNDSAILRRKIKNMTGMDVCEPTAEIEATTGSVVQIFTTDRVGVEFPIAPGAAAGTRVPEQSPLRGGTWVAPAARPTKTGFVIRG